MATFNKWTYKVDTWVRMTKYWEPMALNLLVKYTSGLAGEFFMNYVAGNKKKWTLRKLYEALFDYCFPSDFKDRLRAQLSSAVQGKWRIQDFVWEIEKLVARFPDVNERTIIQTFWNGINQESRLRLIEWGISPEHTPLEKIVHKAVDIKSRDEAYKRELDNFSGRPRPPRRGWGRFVNCMTGP